MTCGSCGTANPDDARFCNSCGRPLVSRGDERRIVTVVFGDLVGFTRLSEARDPEQVKNLVDGCFEGLAGVITEFGGEVDKIMGDALVALFGAPVAHEDDAERAVRAALRMQEEVARFAGGVDADVRMRIGVNTGEVLVGSLRAGGDYTAMGDVVNTAQRLQVAASPGAVVVGPATHQATRDVIAYEPLGSVAVRGRDEPIDAWRAIQALLPPGYRPRRQETPFVGRDAEIGLLSHAVDAAVERRRAQLLVVLGEAGAGKSRLAEEVACRARTRHNAVVFEGRCVPYGEANVWWPVAEALRQACDIAPDDTLADADRQARLAVSSALELPADAPEVGRVVAGLLYLMGYEVPLRDIEPTRAREDATRAVLRFIEASARQRLVVIVMSDLHWADDLVLELITSVIDRLARSPFVLVATARSEFADRWAPPTGRHNTSLVHLDPLDRKATAALLDALIDRDLRPDLRDALLDRSGGNPFFLEELVALLADNDPSPDEVPEGDRPWHELPDTLRGLVSARIDGLSATERATLEDAAVWGRSGPVLALETMAEQIHGSFDVGGALASLADKEILVIADGRWRFHSDLLREVAYGTLTKADRARRHCGIAFHLERSNPEPGEAPDRTVAVVAHHYGAAAELIVELGGVDGIPAEATRRQAIAWLEEAARRAELGQALPLTIRLYTQLLALVADDGEPPPRIRYRLGRAAAEVERRLFDEAGADIDAARDAAVAAGDDALAARAVLVSSTLHQRRGDLDEALRTVAEAVERFTALDDRQGLSEATRFEGMIRIFRGEYELAEVAVVRALDMSREVGDRRGEAWALQNLAWIAYIAGRAEEAEQRLGDSASMFAELGDSGGQSWVMGLLAFVRFYQGRFEEAEELGAHVLVEARERGDRWGEGMMLLVAALVQLWSGRARIASATASEALERFRAIGDRFGEGQAVAAAGRALIGAGEVQDGLRLLDETVDRHHDLERGEEPWIFAAMALAGAATSLGEPHRALAALAAYPDGEQAFPAGMGVTDRAVSHALADLQLGRVEDAIDLLLPVLDLPPDELIESSYALSVLALAHAAAGQRDEALVAAGRVGESPRATYLDRCYAGMAVVLVRGAVGSLDLARDVDPLLALVDSSDDRAAQALARLAVGTALGGAARDVRADADGRLAELGITMPGWRVLFETAWRSLTDGVSTPT